VNARLIATAEAFEAQVGRVPESAELIARIRDGTAAPARARRRRKRTSGLERAHRSREEISVFERAYAETGNPLYVWHALSVLCVHGVPGGNTDDSLLPGWCVDYLSHTAEALLELPPLGGQSEGGIAEQAPAVSKALGLTRQGWNAYAERLKDRDSVLDADLYARVKALGIPDKDAMEATVEELGLEADRSVRRRLHRARRAKPKPAEPGP
jgi:hypothetical protein